MPKTSVQTRDIKDGEVKRDDLNVVETGSAVIRKVIAGDGIVISSTGVDAGTGDVTIRVKHKRTLQLILDGKNKLDEWLKLSNSSILSQDTAVMFDKTYYLKKVYFSQSNSNLVVNVRAYSVPDTNLGAVTTADQNDWNARSDDTEVIKNVGPGKNFIWIAGDESNVVSPNRRHAFRVERVSGTGKFDEVRIQLEFEEVVP